MHMLARAEEDNEEVELSFLQPEEGEMSDQRTFSERKEDPEGRYVEYPERPWDRREGEPILRNIDLMNRARVGSDLDRRLREIEINHRRLGERIMQTERRIDFVYTEQQEMKLEQQEMKKEQQEIRKESREGFSAVLEAVQGKRVEEFYSTPAKSVPSKKNLSDGLTTVLKKNKIPRRIQVKSEDEDSDSDEDFIVEPVWRLKEQRKARKYNLHIHTLKHHQRWTFGWMN